MRNMLLICLIAVLATHTGISADILSYGNTANIPEAGVPQELARWRKATYTDVRYRLHFDIPGERTERVGGRITVSLRLEAPADIVLDFREPASSVHEVSINGIKTFMTSIGKSEMQTNGTRGESSWADGERISRADGETRGADGETNSTDRETGRTNGETSGANGEISQVTENNGRTAGDVGSTNVQGNRTGKDRQPQPCCIIQNEHIVIPAALTKAGENTVDIVFTAGGTGPGPHPLPLLRPAGHEGSVHPVARSSDDMESRIQHTHRKRAPDIHRLDKCTDTHTSRKLDKRSGRQ